MSDRRKAKLPAHAQLLLPLLEAVAESGGTATPSEVYDRLTDRFALPQDVLDLTIPVGRDGSGTQSRFHHRIRWVRQSAIAKGLLRAPKRGIWELTDLAEGKLGLSRPGLVITVFETERGQVLWGQAEDATAVIEPGTVDLLYTSPPYPLLKPKEYGNLQTAEWLDWMSGLAQGWKTLLGDQGSLVLNLGSVGMKNSPAQDPYIERFTLRLIDELGYHLIDRMALRNPSKPPVPRLWVAVRRVRLKGSLESVLWFSPSATPKADNRRVLQPYKASTVRNRKQAETASWGRGRQTRAGGGMQISEKIYQDNGGAIPDVLFDAAPEGPNSLWRRACKMAGCNQHPAISPRKPIETMIGLTTEPGDLVYDSFGGSLLTAKVAEDLGRRWITTERSLDYIKSGCLRFETAGKGQ